MYYFYTKINIIQKFYIGKKFFQENSTICIIDFFNMLAYVVCNIQNTRKNSGHRALFFSTQLNTSFVMNFIRECCY